MKVLIINNHFSPMGGAEVMSYDTYNLLKKYGIDVYFWSSDKKPYFEPDYPYQNYFTKYTGGISNLILHPFRYYNNKEAARDLNKFLSEHEVDLIHLNCFDLFSPLILKECCKNIPTIMTVHDVGLICPSYKLLYKQQELCTNQYCKKGNYLQCLINKCAKQQFLPSLIRTIYAYVLHKNIQYIDKFITPSDALKQKILFAEIGIKEKDIITINNFLKDDYTSDVPSYTDKGYFLYVGRLVKTKGVQYLLQAIKELPKDIKIHIAGTGDYENTLKEYVKENNLENVVFFGQLSKTQLDEEYRNCIATIVPSNIFEVFGLINIESFMNGKPVIASNIGGIPEIVENNKTGLLFEPTNIEQLKNCLLKYWKNRNLAVEHGEHAYIKAKTKYSEQTYIENLLHIYEEVIKNGKRN